MRIYKVLSLIILLSILIFPFYAFADFSFSNSIYNSLKYILRLILFLILILNFKYLKIPSLRNSSFKYYLFYIFLALISIAFSSNKAYSFIKFSEVTIIFFTSILIVNRYSNKIEDVPKIISLILGSYLIGFIIISNTFYPSVYRYMGYGGLARLGGGLINPNLLAYCMLIMILALQYLKYRYIKLITFFQIALIVGIYLTFSRSALIVLFLLLIVKFSKKKIFFVLSTLFLFIYSTQIQDSLLSFIARGEGLQRVFSFSGRLPIWQELLSIYKFDIYSIFGRGFQMLSENGLGIKIDSFGSANVELTMAHNNFIQVLYGMGIIGLTFSILVFTKLHKEINLIQNNRLRGFLYSSYLAILTFSFVEFGVYGSPNIIILIFSIFIFATYKYVRP